MTPSPLPQARPTKARHGLLVGAAAVAGVLTFAACSADAATASAPPPALTPVAARVGVAMTLPPANGRFDYQIGGSYAPAAGVRVVDRDRMAAPVSGTYTICYVNAFQSQPEDKAFWTGRHRDLLVAKNGKLVTDPNWPGEYLLDTSTADKRNRLAAIENAWIDGCATSGFRAVEPDNLDSWTRSKGVLGPSDNVAFATLLTKRAHAKGLAAAQKNTNQLGTSGKTKVGFDFAIAEECQVYDECGDYTDVYGANVIEIEYTDNPRRFYTRACQRQGRQISVILRDRDVVARGESGYHYENC